MIPTATYEFWREWFAQPEEAKRTYLRSPGKGGWYPAFSEAPGYGKPDPKEYFHYRLSHRGMNVATDALFDECHLRAEGWLVDRGLGGIIKACPPENHVLRILHYLPTPDGVVGEAHRDFDLLTVSVPGTVPGLEVFAPDQVGGFWFPQEEGIQIGEMLEAHTRNDLPCDVMHVSCGHPWECRHQDQGACTCHRARCWQATTHRVRTAPNTERFKAVFFYLPPNDFELSPSFTAGDYLKEALSKAGTINIGAKQP